MHKFSEETLKALRENRLETLDLRSLGFKGKAILSGHTYNVRSLAMLPDGRLASGSWDATIRLWNVRSGECEATLSGHTNGVGPLALLPDGRLVSGSIDRTIRLWNMRSGECEAILSGHTDGVSSLVMLPDGRLASGSCDNTIRLWNVSSGKCEATLSGHADVVSSLAMLSDGRLASGSCDNTIRLWNVSKSLWSSLRGRCEATLSGHENWVASLAVLPDGCLASGSCDNTIRLWNVRSGECEAILSGHENTVASLAMLPDGHLASGARDNTIRLWKVSSGECEAILSHENAVISLVVLPDGRLAAGEEPKSSASEAYIRLWPIALDKSLFLSLQSALEKNNTLKKIVWSECESLFNDEEHAWLKALLKRNQTSKIAAMSLPSAPKVAVPPKVISHAASGAGAIADDSARELVKLKAELAEEKNRRLEAELAAAKAKADAEKFKEPAVSSSFSIISSKDLKLGKVRGKGGFGIVYEAKWGEKDVAVKSLHMTDLPEKLVVEFQNEALLQAGLHHDNIVKLKGVCLETSKYALVMELMLGGSLYHLLHNGKELPWSLRLSIAKDIVAGLCYLHDHKIIHRDLKSMNVLLDDRLRAKLTDFGLSKVKSESSSITGAASLVGTIGWMAPELFTLRPKYTESSDLYALGMVFWELSSRELPYPGVDKSVVMDLVKVGGREEIPGDTPFKIASLIHGCWAQKVENRPTSAKVVLDELMSKADSAAYHSGYEMFSH